MRNLFDISVPLSSKLPVWPGDPLPEIDRFSKMEEGEDANVSRMTISVHFGTHVDAPFHFVADGNTVEQLLLDVLTGPAWVIQIPEDCMLITRQVLEGLHLPEKMERVLFRTRNSLLWQAGKKEFDRAFTALSADGAEYLVEIGVQLVGIDYLSIAPFDEPLATHRTLLENGVIILESVDLSSVPAGEYDLYCLPLKLVGAEGAPARAILISKEDM